jgi:hypothetical protein
MIGFRLTAYTWLIGLLVAGVASAQEAPLPPDHHPWARFPVGSWKSVRVITETLDDDGNVANVSLTDTKTSLVSTDATGVTLRTEVTVEIAGKRFASQPQLTRYGLYGETAGEMVSAKKTGEQELAINGVRFKCETRQVTFTTDQIKRVSTLQYSAERFPYVLRRETTASDAADAKVSTTLVETIATDLPLKVLGEIEPGASVRTVRSGPKGSAVTLEVQCYNVPGGVVSHTAKEMNEAGRITRRSLLELVDYSIGIGQADENPLIRRRKFHRGRPR